MARICGHKEKNKMYIYTTNVGSEGFGVQSFVKWWRDDISRKKVTWIKNES